MKESERVEVLEMQLKSNILILKACAALECASPGFKQQIWYRIDNSIDCLKAIKKEGEK
jgi:hypothetical protein